MNTKRDHVDSKEYWDLLYGLKQGMKTVHEIEKHTNSKKQTRIPLNDNNGFQLFSLNPKL